MSRATRASRARRKTSRRRWGGGDVFVALADPTRRRIMDLLSEGDKPVHTLSDTFDVSRPAISQHLRVLREANLVQEHRVGRETRRFQHILDHLFGDRLLLELTDTNTLLQ